MLKDLPYKKIIWSLLFMIFFVVLLNLSSPFVHFLPSEYKENYFGLFGLIIILVMTWGVLKREKTPRVEVGLAKDGKTLSRFIKGSLLGFGIGAFMMGIIFLFSDMEIKRSEHFNVVYFVIFSSMIFVRAFMEELAFRGWAFIRLNQAIGLRGTIIISSIIFAWYHNLQFENFGMTLLGPGIWGLFYAWATIKTGGISFPTGIHFGINFLQSMLGMKGHFTAFLWEVDLPPDYTPEMLARVDMFGLSMQIILLIFSVILIERFIKSQPSKEGNPYLN